MKSKIAEDLGRLFEVGFNIFNSSKESIKRRGTQRLTQRFAELSYLSPRYSALPSALLCVKKI